MDKTPNLNFCRQLSGSKSFSSVCRILVACRSKLKIFFPSLLHTEDPILSFLILSFPILFYRISFSCILFIEANFLVTSNLGGVVTSVNSWRRQGRPLLAERLIVLSLFSLDTVLKICILSSPKDTLIDFYGERKGGKHLPHLSRGRETSLWERNIHRLPFVGALAWDQTHDPDLCPEQKVTPARARHIVFNCCKQT